MVTDQIPAELSQQQKTLTEQTADNQRRSDELTRRGDLLSNAISNSQQTINQLLQLQRIMLEKEAELSTEGQTALAQNLELFLNHQRQSQSLSEEIVALNLTAEDLNQQSRNLQQLLADAEEPLLVEYREALQRYEWRLAAVKLAVLTPLMLVAGLLLWKFAGGSYAILIYALSAALVWRVLLVMHEHFPEIYFRYLLIVTALVLAIWVLVKLLRSVAHPAQAWLQNQYREAYAAFMCPVCEYPIRRGPMKFAAWTRRTLHKSALAVSPQEAAVGDVPYTCPCCTTTLYETCEKCGDTRHSLLPACEKCGHKREPIEAE